mgnify:FL=1|jgi:hypothetical protein|tara:strand:+ start:1007 stop:1471 length:465 start_codon:yes stop_codon:yes gene_type:complete
MSRVLKWWLMFCLSILLGFIAYHFGLIQEIYTKDVTKLSLFIFILYISSSIYIGKTTYASTTGEDVSSRIDIGWFTSESMLALGMVGTVVGFILMLGGSFENIDTGDAETLKSALSDMARGMSTALYTTLSGLVCSLLTKVQLVNLETGINNEV